MVAAFVGSAQAAQPAPGHTPLQAEHNVFRAVRVLRRWGTPFVDPKLNVVRSTTQVACAGRGRPRAGRYMTFICTMRYRSNGLRFRYTVHHGNGFGMLRLHSRATAAAKSHG